MALLETFSFVVNVIFGLFFVVCLAGLVIPIFPGLQLAWAGMLLHMVLSVALGQGAFNPWVFAGITILMALGTVVDNFILAAQLRKVDTPWFAIGIAYVAGIVSGLALSPLAAIFVTPLSLWIVEYIRLKDKKTALASVRQWLFSVGWTFLARLAIGIIMILVWLLGLAFS